MVSNAGAPVKIFLENIASECAEDRCHCHHHRCVISKTDPSSPSLPIHSPDALRSAPHCAATKGSSQYVSLRRGVACGFGFWKVKKGRESSRVEPARRLQQSNSIHLSCYHWTLRHQMGGNEIHSYDQAAGCGGGEEELITCAADSCGFLSSGCHVWLQCLLSNALNSIVPYLMSTNIKLYISLHAIHFSSTSHNYMQYVKAITQPRPVDEIIARIKFSPRIICLIPSKPCLGIAPPSSPIPTMIF